MEVIENITIEDIRNLKPAMIYYGANTCWWTHDPMHLGRTAGEYSLPCDPRGGVLFQTEHVEGFLKAAEDSATHYGKHGLRAFIASHYLNCVLDLQTLRPWAGTTWNEYNEAIDRLDLRKSAGPS